MKLRQLEITDGTACVHARMHVSMCVCVCVCVRMKACMHFCMYHGVEDVGLEARRLG